MCLQWSLMTSRDTRPNLPLTISSIVFELETCLKKRKSGIFHALSLCGQTILCRMNISHRYLAKTAFFANINTTTEPLQSPFFHPSNFLLFLNRSANLLSSNVIETKFTEKCIFLSKLVGDVFEGRDFSSKLQLQNITKSTNIELQKIITYKKTCQAILFKKY